VFPRLEVNLETVQANAEAVVTACRRRGVEVWGVTKGTLGCPRVGASMLRGGVAGLADSRLGNLERLRRKLGRGVPLMLLRLPSPRQADAVVELAEVSLNSEEETLAALAAAAARRGIKHEVILMVDLGDRREGVLPPDLVPLAEAALAGKYLSLAGIGANFACYGGVIPTPANLSELADLAVRVATETGADLRVVSGGNSTSLRLVQEGSLPEAVTQLRVGEAILLGREPSTGEALAGTRQDGFRVIAEVIELKRKPSSPRGSIARDAFGRRPAFVDRGLRARALAALGVQDLGAGQLVPEDEGIAVLGASSDHLILDVTEAAGTVRVGSRLAFFPNYGALLALMTSPHVEKRYRSGRKGVPA